MSHECHAEECTVPVPPRMMMCLPHWNRVPKRLQTQVWRHYRPGQEVDKGPTLEYLLAQTLAREAVAVKEDLHSRAFEFAVHAAWLRDAIRKQGRTVARALLPWEDWQESVAHGRTLKTTKGRLRWARKAVEQFNALHIDGTPVEYWVGNRENVRTGKTLGPAFIQSDHASVMIDSATGSWSLGFVCVLYGAEVPE